MTASSKAVGLVVLAAVFVVLGILYFVGAIQVLTSSGHGPHRTHAILFGVLALASLIGANFVRPKPPA